MPSSTVSGRFARRGWPVLTVLAAAWLLGAPGGGVAQEGVIVETVEIAGNRRIPEATVRATLRVRTGEPFSRAALSADIKALVGPDGNFSDVAVDYRSRPDGRLVVRFRLTEKSRVASVLCVGVVEEDPDAVRDALGIASGDFVDDPDVRRAARALESWYRRRGYRYARVGATLCPAANGDADVELQINEGPRVTVDRIVFRGNRSLPDGDLLGRMQTGRAGLFSRAIFDEEQLAADCVRLQDSYRDRGFLDAVVTLLDVVESEDLSSVTPVLGIDEGDPYLVDRIEISGNDLFTEPELRATMRQSEGQRFDRRTVAGDVAAIVRCYRQQAYLDVELLDAGGPALVYRPDAPRVKLVYRLREGEKFRVGEIRLEGNSVTQDQVILRHLPIAPGDWADMAEVRRGLARLRELGYFEADGGVSEPVWEETGQRNVKNLVLRFRETDPFDVWVAGGLGSDSGVFGQLGLIHRNFDVGGLLQSLLTLSPDLLTGRAFAGRGQTLVLSAAPGTRISEYEVRFVEPSVFDTPWRFDVGLFSQRQRFDTYRADGPVAHVSLGRRLDRDLGIRDTLESDTTFRWQVTELSDATDDADVTLPPLALRADRTLRIHSLSQEFLWQAWDDSRWTARGFELRATARTAGGILGGSEEFNELRLFGEVGIPLFTIHDGVTHALALRGRFGWAEEFGDSVFVPLTERFFLGGSRTLRGFDFQGVGPRDRNGDPTGGQAMWATSVEYRLPFWATESGDTGAGGLLFWDAGALAERITDDELDKVRMSVGFGFRIYLPTLGRWPLALDVGFPVAKERDDERRIISISIGRRIL